MRSTSMLVTLALVTACKDDAPSPATATPGTVVTTTPTGADVVEETVALPASLPLPADGRRLARFADQLGMTTWAYRYPAAAAEAVQTAMAGLPRDGDGPRSTTIDGRRYTIAVQPEAAGVLVTVRAYPAGGPPTTPAPAAYPARFPFVAGGTASHAKDGAILRVAYRQHATDLEAATRLAADAAGWRCTAGTPATCTHGAQTVDFAVEPATGGSVLLVTEK